MQFEFKWLVCFYERAGAVKYNTITQNALDSIRRTKALCFSKLTKSWTCQGNAPLVKRPSIWVRDEFQPAFTHLLALFWFWQAQLLNDVFRALRRSSVQEMSNDRSLRNLAFDSTDAPLAYGNNYWARSSNILKFLVKESKILFFWSHVLITSCLTGEKKQSLGNWYHPLCLKCKKCGRQLATGSHAEVNYCSFPYTLFKFRIFLYKTHNIQFIALANTMTTAHFCLWVILVPCLTRHNAKLAKRRSFKAFAISPYLLL